MSGSGVEGWWEFVEVGGVLKEKIGVLWSVYEDWDVGEGSGEVRLYL